MEDAKLFRVFLTKRQSGYVDIKAADEDEAAEKGREQVEDGEVWLIEDDRFTSGYQVDDVEEVRGSNGD